MSQPANTKHIPSLRFPEFSGEWEEKKLGDVSTIITGSTPSTAISEYYGGEKLFVSPVDIQGNRYVKTTKTTLTFSGFNQGRKVSKDSVLFVCIGSTIGKVAQAYKECITNQQINSLTANSNNENNFIFSLLELKAPKIRLLAGEQAVPQINKSDFSKLSFLFPKQKEQTKVAAFLSSVDSKIDQLSQKKALLEQYKKGVMQQIFSQQIRFKADDGSDYPEWEEKRLGEVLDYLQPTPYLVSSTEYDDSYDIPVLTAGKTFILGYTNEKEGVFTKNLPVIIFDDFTTDSKYVDFVFKAKSSAMKILVGKSGVSVKFVYEAMQQINYEIGGHGRHWISVFSQMMMFFPCLEEQTKIANFLSAIDSKIEQVGQQLEAAKHFKKGLLQQMFV